MPILPFQIEDASRVCLDQTAEDKPQAKDDKKGDSKDSMPIVNQDVRLDNRVIDLRVPTNQAIFRLQSGVCQLYREFMLNNGFVEIHTPKLIGGASEGGSNVFKFKYFERDACLAQSPQLYKQMALCGDLQKVFEIGRVFRNEGLSRRHNPEFTMLELYQAYTDFRGMMQLTRGLIQHVAENVIGSLTIQRPDGTEIDLSGEWREVAYKDLVKEATGDANWFDLSKEEKLKKTDALGIQVNPTLEDYEITNNVFEKLIEPTLIQPTFVTHIPRELCPLAKITESDATTIDVFELCINGQEIAPAYSEQNDPLIQREMFSAQVGEEVQDMDTEFLTALEYGMPPAGGMGLGIDRLIILLTGAESIRDTILFPSLKPNKD